MNPFTTNNARLLTDEQLEKTHEASLEILQEVGMEVHNATAREVYARHGCDVDSEGDEDLCLTNFRGGYCSAECSSNSNCPSGSHCEDFGG